MRFNVNVYVNFGNNTDIPVSDNVNVRQARPCVHGPIRVHKLSIFRVLMASLWWVGVAFLPFHARCDEPVHAGFLYDNFELTLAPGRRTEAAGPFFYSEQKDTQHTWAIPPLFSRTQDPDTESEEYDFAYPVLTYDRYGQQYRWQFFQLFSFAGGPTQTENKRRRFTLFPVYFQQRSSDPNENYTAVFPFYG